MAMVKIPRKENPMVQGKLWWVWVFLLPIAFMLWIFFELREDRRIQKVKRNIKRAKKEKFDREHWEYDFWFDDQGL